MDPLEVRGLKGDQLMSWNIFFAQVVGMQLHPGFRGEPDLARCAYLADRMYAHSLMRQIPYASHERVDVGGGERGV